MHAGSCETLTNEPVQMERREAAHQKCRSTQRNFSQTPSRAVIHE